jgi:hypothetical protein
MWQSVPGSEVTGGSHLYRQILEKTATSADRPPAPSVNGTKAGKSERKAKLGDQDIAQLWIEDVKRRRTVNALAINSTIQIAIFFLANLRPTIYCKNHDRFSSFAPADFPTVWRGLSLWNLTNLFLFVCLQNAFLIASLHNVKGCWAGAAPSPANFRFSDDADGAWISSYSPSANESGDAAVRRLGDFQLDRYAYLHAAICLNSSFLLFWANDPLLGHLLFSPPSSAKTRLFFLTSLCSF